MIEMTALFSLALHGGMNVWVRDSEWSLKNCHLSPTTMDYASVEGYCADGLQVPLTINTPGQKHKFRTSDCSQDKGRRVFCTLFIKSARLTRFEE